MVVLITILLFLSGFTPVQRAACNLLDVKELLNAAKSYICAMLDSYAKLCLLLESERVFKGSGEHTS